MSGMQAKGRDQMVKLFRDMRSRGYSVRFEPDAVLFMRNGSIRFVVEPASEGGEARVREMNELREMTSGVFFS